MTLEDVSGTPPNESANTEATDEAPKLPRSKLNAKKIWIHKLRIVAKAFVGMPIAWLYDDLMPKECFDVLLDEKGTRWPLKLNAKDKTVSAITDDAILNAVNIHMEDALSAVQKDFACAAHGDLEHVKRFIVTMAPGIPQETVLPVATRSDMRITYERLPFDLDAKGPTPTWDGILGRCTNSEAIKAFFGSLFDPLADRAQFLYLYGPGNDGKGAMIEALSEILKSAHTNQITPKELRFWFSGIYNKRLVTFSECDDFKFAVSEDMKAITGNDSITVDEKGRPVFKAKAICKFMFAANVKPRAQDTPAHKRRLIYSEIGPWSGEPVPTRIFVKKLVGEIHPFLSECWRTYLRLCPNGGIIPVSEHVFAGLIAENNSDFEEILDELFILDSRLTCKIRDIDAVFFDKKLPMPAKMAFIHFIKTSKGIRYQPRKIKEVNGHTSIKGLWGIAPKPDVRITPQYNQGMHEKEWAELLIGHKFANPNGHSGAH